MRQKKIAGILLGLFLACAPALPYPAANAGDCTGFIANVQTPDRYDHEKGSGFAAVRSGPGSEFLQMGEVYLGDEVSVWERKDDWFMVACVAGLCTRPMWGEPSPRGWVLGKYLVIIGVCP